MTPGEVLRSIASFNRRTRLEAQEKASYDYIQAQLIIKGVGICLGDKSEFPSLQEAYPKLFDDLVEKQEEEVQQKKMELSTLRFIQFAQSYNNKFKRKEVPK